MASDNRETDRPEAQPDQPKMPKPVFESEPYESQQSAHEAARKAVAAEFAKATATSDSRPRPDSPPRHGDQGFDPGEHHGELGEAFTPGCHDPQGRFIDKERRIAERLVEDGAGVYPRFRDDTKHGEKNPDAMVRSSRDDPGTVTEFKTLDSSASSSVQRNILVAGQQTDPYGGGNAVIDGRGVVLTAEDARRGYARAVGQANAHNKPMPDRVMIILGDGSIIEFGKG